MKGREIFLAGCLIACAGPKGDPGDPGPTVASAIAEVTPRVGLLARELDVAIAGSETAFDSTTTVAFGAGVTVMATTTVSPDTLVVHVAVDLAASVGTRDVVVTTGATTLTATAGFVVRPSLDVDVVAGTPQQGGLATLAVADLDTNLFDTDELGPALFAIIGNLFAIGGDATQYSLDDLELQAAVATVVLDPLAPAQGQIAATNLDPNDGITPVLTFASDPAQLAIASRPATLLTTTANTTIATGLTSFLYQIPTTGPAIVTVQTAPGTGSPAEPISWVYGPGGTRADLLSQDGDRGAFPVTAATHLYAVVFDGALSGGANAAIDTTPLVVPAALDTEIATAHDTVATAQVLMPTNWASPIVISGELSVPGEVDVYLIGPGGVDVTLSMTAAPTFDAIITADPTQPGGAAEADIRAGTHNAMDIEALGTGPYYLVVRASRGDATGPYTIGLRGSVGSI